MAAFAGLGGVPREILYDRMKTAVIGEDSEAHIVYNRALIDFAGHYGFYPKACRPYRAKTTDEVEYPLCRAVLFSARLRMTSRRSVGLEVKAWPRCLHCRSSFEASVDIRLPRLVHPSVSRL